MKLQSGPATVPLGAAAELKLPENYHFVGPDSLDRFYQLTQNMRGGNEVGGGATGNNPSSAAPAPVASRCCRCMPSAM